MALSPDMQDPITVSSYCTQYYPRYNYYILN